MRYVCSHCGTTFESDEAPKKCPNCLRKHGLLPEEESHSKGRKTKGSDAAARTNANKSSPKWLWAGGVGLLILAAGAGLWWYLSHRRAHEAVEPAKHRLGPQAAASLSEAMVRAGAPKLPIPFEPTEAVKAWAKKHIQGSDIQAKARSLQEALHALLDGRTCKKPEMHVSDNTLFTAGEVLAHSGPARPCHSFALASLGLAAARSVGLKATMVELYAATKSDGTTATPLDPTGGQGHFGIAILSSGYENAKPAAILDPVSANQSQTGSYSLLDDLTALAAYLNLKAQATAPTDPPTARMLAEAAGKLGPNSPSVQCGTGTVLLALGGLSEGSDAVLKAVSLRNDAPRQLCLAMAKLASRDVQGALAALKVATKKSEAFAPAYVVQARIMLALGQPAKAAELLDRADQYQPGLRSTKVLRAMLTAMQGNLMEATSQLERLLKEQPDDPDAFGALWQIYVSTGMTEEADKLAKKFAATMPAQARAAFLAKMKEQRKAIAKMQQAAAGGGQGGQGAGAPAGAPGPGSGPAAGPGPGPGGPGAALPDPNKGPLGAPPPNMDFKLKTPTPTAPGAQKGPKLDLNM